MRADTHNVTFRIELPGSAPAIDFVLVRPGMFVRGSLRGLPLERPVAPVEVRSAFLLGRYPVTRAHAAALGLRIRSEAGSDSNATPATGVSWDDAADACRRLGVLSGIRARLPSEAEWEYACRAGSDQEFHFGPDESALPEFAWFDLNARGKPQPVGQRRPNAWGLHDMIGNVWEWCADVWHDSYESAPSDQQARTDDAERQPRRVLRGGSYLYDATRCRSAYRSRDWRTYVGDDVGFRIAADPVA